MFLWPNVSIYLSAWGWYFLMPGCLLFLYFPSTCLIFCSGLTSEPVGVIVGISWSSAQQCILFGLQPQWLSLGASPSEDSCCILCHTDEPQGAEAPPPPPVSSPERLRPLSPCTDYSRYLIKHLDPPRSPQRATVPPLTHFPPYCVKLWKGVKQNKEGPLKDVATGT